MVGSDHLYSATYRVGGGLAFMSFSLEKFERWLEGQKDLNQFDLSRGSSDSGLVIESFSVSRVSDGRLIFEPGDVSVVSEQRHESIIRAGIKYLRNGSGGGK